MLRPCGRLLLPALLAVGCKDGEVRLASRIDSIREEVDLRGERKLALTPVLGERVQVEVDVPATPLRPFLKFSTAVETRRPVPRARVKFRVSVVSDGFPVIAHEGTVRFKGHNRWRHHWVDLAAWAGKRVTLTFETRPTTSGSDVPWADRIRAIWGDPVVGAREAPESDGRSPSVILIVIDALRYDYLGVNGFPGEVSPNLDWLALESVRFENAIAAAPWTKPSIATVFTGLHPETHGVLRLHRNSGQALSERAVTLAEVFREHGYRTAGFVGNALLSPSYGFQQGFDTYLVDRRGDVLLDELRSWLSAAADSPYFVYLHLIGAHGPYRAPEADYRLLRRSPSPGPARKILPTDPPRPDHLEMTPFATVAEGERLEAWKAKYAAAVRTVDRRLGALLKELRRSGELDRSLVVLTSDHGEEFLEHPSWEHGYELCSHQLHVPLWFRLPGGEGAGARVTQTVSLVDLMPTLLGLSGLPAPERTEGEDRSRWVEDPSSRGGAGIAFASGMLGRPEIHSMWTDRYRFEWDSETGDSRLFDRKEDPAETNDVAELHPDVVARLEERLFEHLAGIAAAGTLSPEMRGIPEDIREELRALGYVQD